MSRLPKRLSPGEEALALHFRACGLEPQREYVFAPPRKFRFDFAFPEKMIAAEVDGGTWMRGRHQTGNGFERDCEKLNLAASLGWRVFRYTTMMVMRGEAVVEVGKALDNSKVSG